MEVSIIIPTYNGVNKLPTLLAALDNQNCRCGFEVVVVIDGSEDGTIELLQTHVGKHNFLFRYVFQHNQGRSEAKNCGVRYAIGSALIFFDDDLEPAADSVQRHVDFHSAHFDSLLCGNALELERSDKTDLQNYKAYLTAKWVESYPNKPVELRKENLFFTSANCSMKRQTFDSLGGFSSELKDAEDFDFAARAFEKGFKVYFDKANVAIHHDPITCKSYIRRQLQYRDAHAVLSRKYPDRIVTRAVDKLTLSYKIRAPFYFLFSFSWWVSLVDRNLMLFLPRAFRYKIYEWTIHSQSVVFPRHFE